MSAAIILDKNLKKSGEAQLPESYKDINSHNLYLYIKSFLASMRANNAIAKTRGRVSGGIRSQRWQLKHINHTLLVEDL